MLLAVTTILFLCYQINAEASATQKWLKFQRLWKRVVERGGGGGGGGWLIRGSLFSKSGDEHGNSNLLVFGLIFSRINTQFRKSNAQI